MYNGRKIILKFMVMYKYDRHLKLNVISEWKSVEFITRNIYQIGL